MVSMQEVVVVKTSRAPVREDALESQHVLSSSSSGQSTYKLQRTQQLSESADIDGSMTGKSEKKIEIQDIYNFTF